MFKEFLGLTDLKLLEPIILKKKQEVFYMLLNKKPTVLLTRKIHSLLDLVEASKGPTALVTLSLSRIFSGGYDLKYPNAL